jgi:hypothetical protein
MRFGRFRGQSSDGDRNSNTTLAPSDLLDFDGGLALLVDPARLARLESSRQWSTTQQCQSGFANS